MNSSPVFHVPSELSFLEFFEAEPISAAPHEGYWCYQVSDERGVTLRLSFNVFERSLQTAKSVQGGDVATVSHEGGERLAIDSIGGYSVLRGEFRYRNSHSTVIVRIRPTVHVEWSSLQDSE